MNNFHNNGAPPSQSQPHGTREVETEASAGPASASGAAGSSAFLPSALSAQAAKGVDDCVDLLIGGGSCSTSTTTAGSARKKKRKHQQQLHHHVHKGTPDHLGTTATNYPLVPNALVPPPDINRTQSNGTKSNRNEPDDLIYVSFGTDASEDQPDTFLIKLSECTPCTCALSPSIVSDDASPIASNYQTIPQHNLRQTIRDFLMSLHQSITKFAFSCSWMGSCTLLIKDMRDYNDEILSKISAWDMLKKPFGSFENFLKACGFDVWQRKKGSRLHTYVSYTHFRSDLCELAFVEGSTSRLSRDV